MSQSEGCSDVNVLLEDGFSKDEFAYLGAVRDVYRKGRGRAVLVLSEIPGITPPTIALCNRLVGAGYRVVLPHLFGDVGRAATPRALAETVAYVCVSREFSLFARREASPVTEWLRALARLEHAHNGGPGVGVIGMCFTGGFALAMMVEPAVMAPVLSQPSLPVPVTPLHALSLGLSDADLTCVRERVTRQDLTVLGLRFSQDKLSPASRFATLHREFGARFLAVEIDSGPGNPDRIASTAHSVLTEDFVDTPGHPTRAALEQVLKLFADTLGHADGRADGPDGDAEIAAAHDA